MGFLKDVKKRAAERNMTLASLAKRAQVNRSSLSAKNISGVSRDLIKKVSEFLELDANQYLQEKEEFMKQLKKKKEGKLEEPKKEWTSLDMIIENVKSAVTDCEKAKEKLQRADAQLSSALGDLARDFQRLSDLRKGVRFLHGSKSSEMR